MTKKKNISKQPPSKLLGPVLEFMAMAGLSEAAIRAEFERSLKQLESLRQSARSEVRGRSRSPGDVSAHLLRLWHRDSRYINGRDFRPRSLPLSRGRNNLRTLIKELDSDANPTEVLQAMRAVGLIRRTTNGRYLPTSNAAILPTLHPWVVEHAVHSVLRLLSTVRKNASSKPGDQPLLERYSYVPDLDPLEVPAFEEFARSQGQVLLDILDDWLEQRRANNKKVRKSERPMHAGIPAGIHLITFVGDGAAKPRVGGSVVRRTERCPDPVSPGSAGLPRAAGRSRGKSLRRDIDVARGANR